MPFDTQASEIVTPAATSRHMSCIRDSDSFAGRATVDLALLRLLSRFRTCPTIVNMTKWVCSLHPQHLDAVLDGSKRYELRRRVPGIEAGDELAMALKGSGEIRCVARVARVIAFESSAALLRAVGHAIPSTTPEQVRSYFAGAPACYAIELRAVRATRRAMRQCMPQGVVRWRT